MFSKLPNAALVPPDMADGTLSGTSSASIAATSPVIAEQLLKLVTVALYGVRPERDLPEYATYLQKLQRMVPEGPVQFGDVIVSNLEILDLGSHGLALSAKREIQPATFIDCVVKLRQVDLSQLSSEQVEPCAFTDPFELEVTALRKLKHCGLALPQIHESAIHKIPVKGGTHTSQLTEALGVIVMDRMPGISLYKHLQAVMNDSARISEIALCWGVAIKLLHEIAECGVVHEDFGDHNLNVLSDPTSLTGIKIFAFDFSRSRLARPGENTKELFREAFGSLLGEHHFLIYGDEIVSSSSPMARLIRSMRAEFEALYEGEQTAIEASDNLLALARRFAT